MLGALFRICSFLDADSMRAVIQKTFEKKYPHLVEPNIRTFDRGFNEVVFKSLDCENFSGTSESKEAVIGYKTQLAGGIMTNQGSSLVKDVSGTRQGFLPSFNQSTCINCAACDTVCPDFCFVWKEGEDKRGRKNLFLQGIDYQYCKGCLKCVEACPTGSLAEMRETFGYADLHTVKQSIKTGGAE